MEEVLAERPIDALRSRAALPSRSPLPRARPRAAGPRTLLVAAAAARREDLVRLAVEAGLRVVVCILGGVAGQLARGMGSGNRPRQPVSEPRLAAAVRVSNTEGRV